MSAAAMSRIKLFSVDAHDDEALCKPRFSPLLDGRQISLHILRVQPETARLIATRLNQEAGGACHTAGIRATLEAIHNTPPQVDKYTYINEQSKTRARVVGKRRGDDQRGDGNKPKPGEKKPEPKPDKKKPRPKPGREGDREPREPREPNAKTKER